VELEIFRSGKGDCLLLSSTVGPQKRVLIDGGMPDAYRRHVAAPLARRLNGPGDKIGALDVVYVSHIDQDHIGGVLEMIDAEFAWRVYDFKRKSGATWPKPEPPRPPAIKQFWFNAFEDQLGGEGGGGIENAVSLAATLRSIPAFGGSLGGQRGRDPEEAAQDLATSIAEAVRLSHRLRDEQLGVPINRPASGGLMLLGAGASKPVRVGKLTFTLLGPSKEIVDRHRKEWNAWLRENKARARGLRDAARRDAKDLGPAALETAKLGDRGKVTTPNLASLMFLVEQGPKTLLLTGDGHGEDIVAGLRRIPRFKTGPIHVDALKVQHHASEHNWSEEFGAIVTADHYVFCGNGEHENPDLAVLDAIAGSRLGSQGDAPKGPLRDFTFWFSGNSAHDDEKAGAVAHLKKVEKKVAKLAADSAGRLKSKFMPADAAASPFKLTI
jgi:beta-lactamase superfamily II metal-dependent hydrolase